MIGTGIKKFAQANGLTVKKGVAYGLYNGIHIAMQEGVGWKSVSVAAYFETEEQLTHIRGWLADEKRQQEYRIQGCSVTDVSVKPGAIRISFLDNPGTMKKIEGFLPQLTSLLTSLSVKSAGVCHGCGQKDEGVEEVLLSGNVYRLHSACTAKVEAELADDEEEKKRSGSMASGILGAAVGAVVGIIPWVLVYFLGYLASLAGLVIGYCAKKGYELAKGKETRAKVVVILVCVLLAVVLAECVSIVAVNIPDGLELGWTVGEVIDFVFTWALTEGLGAVIKEILLGWLFALLGIYGILINTFRQTKTNKLTRL